MPGRTGSGSGEHGEPRFELSYDLFYQKSFSNVKIFEIKSCKIV
jgi:hypothetical protein